jgi:hypothetical protein
MKLLRHGLQNRKGLVIWHNLLFDDYFENIVGMFF